MRLFPAWLVLWFVLLPNAWAGDPLRVGWYPHVGWLDHAVMQMPLIEGKDSFLKQRSDQLGGTVEMTRFDDPKAAIQAFMDGKLDICTMTLTEAMGYPIRQGIATSCILIHDYSNGNDGICIPKSWTWANLKNQTVLSAEFSPGHYLIWRGLQLNKLPDNHCTYGFIDETRGPRIFEQSLEKPVAVALRNPWVEEYRNGGEKTKLLFSTRQIPGEIIHVSVIRRDSIQSKRPSINAYVHAHYDVMRLYNDPNKQEIALNAMAEAAHYAPDQRDAFKTILSGVKLYIGTDETVNFMISPAMQEQHLRLKEFLRAFHAAPSENLESFGLKFDPSFIKSVF